MKKISFLTIFVMFATPALFAQETGAAAVDSAEVASSNWQNWVFAGSALVTAAIGVVIISTNTGSFGH